MHTFSAAVGKFFILLSALLIAFFSVQGTSSQVIVHIIYTIAAGAILILPIFGSQNRLISWNNGVWIFSGIVHLALAFIHQYGSPRIDPFRDQIATGLVGMVAVSAIVGTVYFRIIKPIILNNAENTLPEPTAGSAFLFPEYSDDEIRQALQTAQEVKDSQGNLSWAVVLGGKNRLLTEDEYEQLSTELQ